MRSATIGTARGAGADATFVSDNLVQGMVTLHIDPLAATATLTS